MRDCWHRHEAASEPGGPFADGEVPEAVKLFATVGGRLHNCTTEATIRESLMGLWRSRHDPLPPRDVRPLADLTWDAQAMRLAAVLADAVRVEG